jgi:ABC-type polysaccharide/polyol phosphate transport system ATPase subunit
VATSSPDPAVVVDALHKRFRRPSQQVHTLKERALHPFRSSGEETFDALKDVSFSVTRGEFFGIVGRNGSGKSTLLKCLTGIYGADAGKMYVDGDVGAFIELGVGFNMDLAARDNIRLNGVMHGLTQRDARSREDEIIHFAGLEEFVDLKIKNYSSGMLVRLGFSIMAHVDAEVLIIDEVLAVGDAAFQQKCYDQFNRLRDEGKTVLFVTHDMGAVERYCDRAMLLERGEVVAIGEPASIGRQYLKVNFAQEADDAGPDLEIEDDDHRITDGRASIEEAWFEDAAGARATTLEHGERATFAARVRFMADVVDPLFGFVLHTDRRETALAASTAWTEEHTGDFAAGDEVTFRITFDTIFSGGRYTATPAVARRGQGIAWIDRREHFAQVLVSSTRGTDAVVDIPYEVTLDRSPAPVTQP